MRTKFWWGNPNGIEKRSEEIILKWMLQYTDLTYG